MEKLQSAPWLGLPSTRLSSHSVNLMGFLLRVLFFVAPLLGERESLVARYQIVHDLVKQSMKIHIPFLYMVIRVLLFSPGFSFLKAGF